jgi:hypothetical protein
MTDRSYQHELNRFSTMSYNQLKTRLYKITDVEKLKNFAEFAIIFRYKDLADLAIEKIEFMKGNE